MMLVNEEPQQWSCTLGEADYQMFPDLEPLGTNKREDDATLPGDDFLEALSSGLEIPLLLNGEGSPGCDETPDEIMKNVFEGIDFSFLRADDKHDEFSDIFSDNEFVNHVKLEPTSPFSQLPPSPSPSQSESSSGSEWPSEISSVTQNYVKFALETPPISPPQNDSPPISPQPAQNNPSQLQPIKVLPLNSINLKDGISQKFVLSDNPAKRICIQPKFENSTKETPRKTIVLSAQDFAALTQKVKQNSTTQPLKVQALPISRHVKIKNHLNLLPVKQSNSIPSATTFPQNNQVKIINSIPNVQIHTKTPVATVPSKPIIKTDAKPPLPIAVKKEITCPSIVIKNDVPVCSPIVIKKENTSCAPIVIKNEFPEFIDLHDRQDSEIKALKRQQRMIKNRESACLSRKKKKEYVTSLESQIADLQEQNKRLQMENAELRQRLSDFDETEKKVRGQNYGVNKKSTAILLAMVFMVSLNIGGLGNVFNQNRQPLGELEPHVPSLSLSNVRHGRTLLWSKSDEQEDLSEKTFNDTLPKYHSMCPMHINRTESIRLDSELRRWIGGEPDRENWTKPSKTDLEVKSLNELLNLKTYPRKDDVNNMRIKSRRAMRVKNKINQDNEVPLAANINAVQVFSPLLKEHAKLFEALGRRDDTFYVVWFTGDHLLLPASRKNSTTRPRMSLILPAVPVNGSYYSTPPNHVTMMQIDCEVTNTQLLHLKEAIIPKHLKNQRQSETNSQKSRNTEMYGSRASNTTKNYKPYFLKENIANSLHSNSFKDSYDTEDKNSFSNKNFLNKKKLNSNFHLNNAKYAKFKSSVDVDQVKVKELVNEIEELKNATYPQERRMIKRKIRRPIGQ